MVAQHDPMFLADRFSQENSRLRELLKRWVRLERVRPTADEFEQLCDATKRALFRIGPDWYDDDE